MQACQDMQQENMAIGQRLTQETQDWSAGEIQRQEAVRRAATAEAELELLDVSCDSLMSSSHFGLVLGQHHCSNTQQSAMSTIWKEFFEETLSGSCSILSAAACRNAQHACMQRSRSGRIGSGKSAGRSMN